MDVKERLESVLSMNVSSPEDAERAGEAAQLLATYLRLEERVRALTESREETGRPEGQSVAGLTLPDAAERVLDAEGVPLHARDLGALMKARGWRHPRSKVARPELILHQLAGRLPRDSRFRRVAPQTFALAKWGDESPGGRRKPKLPLFEGPGTSIAAEMDNAPEAPFEDERAAWRSS